jgi:hypothetical protein
MKCGGPVMYSQTRTSCELCKRFDKTCSFGEPQVWASGSQKRQREDEEDEEYEEYEEDEEDEGIIRCPKRMKSSTMMERLAEEKQEREDHTLAEDVREAYEGLGRAQERVTLAELKAKRALSWARGRGVVLSAKKEQEEEDCELGEAVSDAYEALGKAKGAVMLAELRAGRALSQA